MIGVILITLVVAVYVWFLPRTIRAFQQSDPLRWVLLTRTIFGVALGVAGACFLWDLLPNGSLLLLFTTSLVFSAIMRRWEERIQSTRPTQAGVRMRQS